MYGYAYQNPVNFYDPTGEIWVGALIGGVAGIWGAYIQGGECVNVSDLLKGALVGAITGAFGGGIANLAHKIGGLTGAGLGALGGGLSGAMGSFGGQIATGGIGSLSWGAIAGAALGGAYGGAYGALGVGIIGDMMGAKISMTGELIGGALDPTMDEKLGRNKVSKKCEKKNGGDCEK